MFELVGAPLHSITRIMKGELPYYKQPVLDLFHPMRWVWNRILIINQRTLHYSSTSIKQAHGQANKRVTGVEGVIGITESPETQYLWVGVNLAFCIILKQFTDVDDYESQELLNHVEGSTSKHHLDTMSVFHECVA